MRITVGKSGLFWTFFEPFFQTFIFIGIHILIAQKAGHSAAGSYNYPVFMASGFIAFNMFKNILNSAMGAFKANKGLFIYKQVKPIDTIIARILVTLFLTVAIIIIFLAVGFFFHVDNLLPKNTLMVILGYLWLVLFSFGVGLLAAIGNTFFVSVGKFIGIISFVLLIFSAIFYPVASLPPTAQEIILYNPLVHFMEMIHGYYIYGLDDRYVNYRYMLMWTVIPIFIGIWLYERLEKRIISE
jgi:capsular polysaccharide transport system permease protein